MVAYSFKPSFIDPILAGTKGGTIRQERKRHARPGEEVQLYYGMRTKNCRLIARKTCLASDPIRLDFIFGIVTLGALVIDGDAIDAFARFDGFEDWKEMARWWGWTHGAPLFEGRHIRWLPMPDELFTAATSAY